MLNIIMKKFILHTALDLMQKQDNDPFFPSVLCSLVLFIVLSIHLKLGQTVGRIWMDLI